MIIEDLAAIGIEVSVTRASAAEARSHRSKPGHGSLFTGNWFADFPDSDNFFYSFFHSQSEAIPGIFYKSPELDAAIDEGRRTTDGDRRAEIYSNLNRRILEESPLCFLFHERLFVLHKPEIRGLRTYLVPPPVRYSDVWIEQ
jgi:ABC-type transport system substrate-binding protein